MEEHKSFLAELVELINRHALRRKATSESSQSCSSRCLSWLSRQLIPNLGSVVLVLILLTVFPGIAAPLNTPSATSISAIPYQGRLADSGGTPITGMQNMEFRIYDVPTGGVPLWEELWTGGNSVSVSDGLFSVMLGSINTDLASVVQGYDELYLGITVGTDSEMSPRVQLGSVPFSMQALTVPDGSVSTAKIANGAVTQAKLGGDIDLEPPDGSVSTEKLADGAVTSAKLNIDDGLVVSGTLALTGTLDGQSSHWADYRAYLRFLRDDGVAPADLCPEGGVPVGVIAPKQSLLWKTGDDICQHNYDTTRKTCLNVHKVAPCGSIIGNFYPYNAESCSTDYSGQWAPFYWWDAQAYADLSFNILGTGIGCFNVRYACCTSP